MYGMKYDALMLVVLVQDNFDLVKKLVKKRYNSYLTNFSFVHLIYSSKVNPG